MSRTIRRKNSYSLKYCKENALYFNEDATEKDFIKEWHYWHCDKDLGYTPPKSFVKTLNRTFRAKSKETLVNALYNAFEDEVVFDPFIKNAGWYYW